MPTTIDFHVTSECNQECPYCWGPQDFDDTMVDTATARAIVHKIAFSGAKRIVFTGGDPLLRTDIGELIKLAKEIGLEVAVSTTGDKLTHDFLAQFGRYIDLMSLPLDGSSEIVSSRTKKQGHFTAIRNALKMLAHFPAIDVKIATPVTRHNLADIPNIVRLLDQYAVRMPNRLFYNVFQAFPRAMSDVDWNSLVVSDEEFDALSKSIDSAPHAYRINWLSHDTLDRLYVMVFPDGSLTVPSGPDYLNYGPFLDVYDLEKLLSRTDFDAPKHHKHSKGWNKAEHFQA